MCDKYIVIVEKLRKANGLYTEKQIQRCSRLGGQFSKDLQRLFAQNIGSERLHVKHSRHYTEHKDVRHFLENSLRDGLFDNIPGRCHVGFENITHEWKVNDPDHLTARLQIRSRKLDLWRKFSSA